MCLTHVLVSDTHTVFIDMAASGYYRNILKIVNYICGFQPAHRSVEPSNIFVLHVDQYGTTPAGRPAGPVRRKKYVVAVSATGQSEKLERDRVIKVIFTCNDSVFFCCKLTYCRHIANHRRKTGSPAVL